MCICDRGKIDDIDKVYLNGELVGTYKDMYNTPLGSKYLGNWQMRRAYKIPENLLNKNGLNTIAVAVFDEGGIGGIYEGPVGIMTLSNYEVYEEANEPENYFHSPFSIIEMILNEIFY
jgi:sialate O-acetylesterase